jgi:ankyrin repeat protein
MSSLNEQFYWSAWGGELVDVKRVVRDDADVNFKHEDGSTALHGASVRGYTELVRFLVEKGAEVNCRDNLGNTALHFGSTNGHTEVVRFLIENGADIHCQDYIVGWTALHYACQCGALDAAFILFLEGADLSVTNMDGKSPLDVVRAKRCLSSSKPDIEGLSSSKKQQHHASPTVTKSMERPTPSIERVIAKAA